MEGAGAAFGVWVPGVVLGNDAERRARAEVPTTGIIRLHHLGHIVHDPYAASLLHEIKTKAMLPRSVDLVQPIKSRQAEAARKALAAPVENPLHRVGARDIMSLHAQII